MKSACLISALMIVTVAASELCAGGEPFQKEQWPQARTLVWARPGKSGLMQTANNWTEYASAADYLAGKNASPAETPPDKKTDIILPDSPDGQSYVVGCFVRRKGSSNIQMGLRLIRRGASRSTIMPQGRHSEADRIACILIR
jgi:hypothetical protein